MSPTNDAITPKHDTNQAPLDEKAVEIVIDKKLGHTSEAEVLGEVDISTGEIDDVLHESEFTEDEYKALLKKIDRWLLPLMFCCYGIQQTDKTATGTQAIFGLRTDLGLQGQQYNWLTTIFYVTYLVGEFPSNFLLQRWSIGRCLTVYMMCWAICLICTSAVTNWSQLMALRALQGFFECTISPGFLLIIGSWYRTEEQASRALFWQAANAFFLIVCDLSMYGIAGYVEKHGGIQPWRTISLFLGSLTVLLAVAAIFLLGTPKEVRWLSKREKRMAQARIVRNKAGRDTTGTKWSWPQVTDALKDPQTWFSFCNAFINNIPNGGLTSFGSIMYTSFGFINMDVLLVSLPRSAISLILFTIIGYYIRRVQNRRMYIMMFGCVTPFIGLLAMSLLPDTAAEKWIKWGLYIMTMPFVFPIFLAWSLIPSNVAGRTKKTVVSSLTFLAYCIGNIGGSFVFKTSDAPRYVSGTIACSICFALEFGIILAWRFWYMYENKRRDKAAAASGLTKEEQEAEGRLLGEQDVTDRMNPHFRYTM
ncbi:major facilitator superfamily domain-containing protein [Xylariales sp. PMI_506]|nr:major facilitator superfamily domain-containing protein [Xylariales sp. PMI_506]